MSFPTLKLTDAGRSIIINALTGGQIVFTKIGIGDGKKTDNINSLTELINQKAVIEINKIEMEENFANLTAVLDNTSLEEGFWWKEIGIFAKSPNGDEELYAYANAENYAEWIPAFSDISYLRTTINIAVAIGDAENVSAIIGAHIGYATKEEFDKHINAANPHIGAADKKHSHSTEDIPGLYEVTEIPYKDFLVDFRGLSNITQKKCGNRIYGYVSLEVSVEKSVLKQNNYEYKIAEISSPYHPKYPTNFTFAEYLIPSDLGPPAPIGVVPVNIKDNGGIYLLWSDTLDGQLNIPFDYICEDIHKDSETSE